MASPVLAFAQLANECEKEGLTVKNGERIATELSKTFSVKMEEVGILRLEKQNLVFVYPQKLQNIGSIPLNTASSVAARTANTKRAEVLNNFAQAKHTSVFEAVELTKATPGQKVDKHAYVIQKLMSVPVVGPNGVLGVIQISRKGTTPLEAGPDFTPGDVQKLVTIATSLAKCFK